MGQVAHMNGSCHASRWEMSHIRTRHDWCVYHFVTRGTHTWVHKYECVMAHVVHTCTRRANFLMWMHDWCHAHEWVTSHKRMTLMSCKHSNLIESQIVTYFLPQETHFTSLPVIIVRSWLPLFYHKRTTLPVYLQSLFALDCLTFFLGMSRCQAHTWCKFVSHSPSTSGAFSL